MYKILITRQLKYINRERSHDLSPRVERHELESGENGARDGAKVLLRQLILLVLPAHKHGDGGREDEEHDR